jgi:hypothetical protein
MNAFTAYLLGYSAPSLSSVLATLPENMSFDAWLAQPYTSDWLRGWSDAKQDRWLARAGS